MSLLARLFGRRDPQAESRALAARVEAALGEAKAAYDAGDYDKALRLWDALAEEGVPRAMANLGGLYAYGLGVPRDDAVAARWMELAADLGDPLASQNLALMIYEGRAPGEASDARERYRFAAEAGLAEAQNMLSWMLLEGAGGEREPLEARRWAEAAAAQDNASAQCRLGQIHHNAWGVERNPVEAARWFEKAARQGDAEAQAMLGAACLLGLGVEQDVVAALRWLGRARDQGHALAAGFLVKAEEQASAAEKALARTLAANGDRA